MRRVLLGWLVGVAAAVGVAAPVPKDFKRPTYFPTEVGCEWEYAHEGEKEAALTVEITKVTAERGGRVVLFEQTGGTKVRDYPERFRVNAEGVFLLSAADKELDPPRLDLKAKPKADDAWNAAHAWNDSNYTLTTVVGAAETVTVPAGTFTALPHAQSYTNFQPPQVWTAWHAPGVGRVKFVNYEGRAYVLLKFTPGKEKK